jgi:hypothetical protein
MLERSIRSIVKLDTIACDRLDRFREIGQRLGAELACLALQGVGWNDQRRRAAGAHRRFDRCDRLHAVFAEIAEDADEPAAKLAAGLLKRRPVDQGVSFE